MITIHPKDHFQCNKSKMKKFYLKQPWIPSLDLLGGPCSKTSEVIFFFHYSSIHFGSLFVPGPEMTWLSKADKVGSRWWRTLVRIEVCGVQERIPLWVIICLSKCQNTGTIRYRSYQDFHCPQSCDLVSFLVLQISFTVFQRLTFKCVMAYSSLGCTERTLLLSCVMPHTSKGIHGRAPHVCLSLIQFICIESKT